MKEQTTGTLNKRKLINHQIKSCEDKLEQSYLLKNRVLSDIKTASNQIFELKLLRNSNSIPENVSNQIDDSPLPTHLPKPIPKPKPRQDVIRELKPLRIYVAGPYTNPNPEIVKRNVDLAASIGYHIMERGHTPFVPHLGYYIEHANTRAAKLPFSFNVWMNQCLSQLKTCDALFVIMESPGTNIEIEYAKRKGMTIFQNISEIPIVPLMEFLNEGLTTNLNQQCEETSEPIMPDKICR